jgi:hypothetical protein
VGGCKVIGTELVFDVFVDVKVDDCVENAEDGCRESLK